MRSGAQTLISLADVESCNCLNQRGSRAGVKMQVMVLDMDSLRKDDCMHTVTRGLVVPFPVGISTRELTDARLVLSRGRRAVLVYLVLQKRRSESTRRNTRWA